jgi:hypothetical protein
MYLVLGKIDSSNIFEKIEIIRNSYILLLKIISICFRRCSKKIILKKTKVKESFIIIRNQGRKSK